MISTALSQRRQWWTRLEARPLFWLVGLGALSGLVYLLALVYGNFRPHRIEPFLAIFGAAFALYALAVWLILRSAQLASQQRMRLGAIFAFAVLFNLLLLPSQPSLSDDMFRYVWDGRVQAAGINPYRFASNAPELAYLRDDSIWQRMNRKDAVTIYPPFAQMVFAATWRIFPNSVTGFKLVMIGATLLAGWLLVLLLKALEQPPERVLIFLWSPLLIFEIAHAGHVDALYLPLIVGAFLLRARSRGSWYAEAGIGILLGLATLVKLYPAILAVPLWSLRDAEGKRRWRLALPVALVLTVLAGYAFYLQPGVDTLGFLPKYGKEIFNISPLIHLLIEWGFTQRIPWYQFANLGMPLLVGVVSLIFILFPARSARQAILCCFWPIGIYLLINHNLFSWYAVWLLPLLALDLRFSLRAALAWWIFTGTIALSYTFFIYGKEQNWAIWLEFTPVYALLILAASFAFYRRLRNVPNEA
ncbi:MAG: glycosyltransferase 87 family protein [Chloroflexota bacterium]